MKRLVLLVLLIVFLVGCEVEDIPPLEEFQEGVVEEIDDQVEEVMEEKELIVLDSEKEVVKQLNRMLS